jgi:hypothetical protein
MHDATRAPQLKSTRSALRSARAARINLVKHAGPQLSPSARLVLRSLIDYLGDSQACWPSVGRLAYECGLSSRQVRRILRDLESSGWLHICPRRRENGSQTSSLIHWIFPAPEQQTPRTSTSGTPRTSTSPHEKHIPENSEQHYASCRSETDVQTTPTAAAPEPLLLASAGLAASTPENPLSCQQQTILSDTTAPAVLVVDETDNTAPVAIAAILPRLPRRKAPAGPAAQSSAERSAVAAIPLKAAAPAIPAVPAGRPGSRWITINAERMSDPKHAAEVYLAATAAGLLRESESNRLAFLACWCEALRRSRAGKCRNPAAAVRWLLSDPRLLAEYPTAASEDKARRLVLRVFA